MSEHDALCRQHHWAGVDCFDCRLIAKVRADEGKRDAIAEVERAWAERADLRAKVEALVPVAEDESGGAWLWRSDVLALIDGSSNV